MPEAFSRRTSDLVATNDLRVRLDSLSVPKHSAVQPISSKSTEQVKNYYPKLVQMSGRIFRPVDVSSIIIVLPVVE